MYLYVTKFSSKLVNKKKKVSFYFVQPLIQTCWSNLVLEDKGDGGWGIGPNSLTYS